MKWIASILLTLVFVTIPMTVFAGTESYLATQSIFKTSKDKLKTTSVDSGLGDPTALQAGVSNTIGNAINTAVGFLGVVAVILIIYAGGLWLTAAGSEDKIKKAKQIIKSTVVGMIIVGFAYAITAFVISQVSKPIAPSAGDPALKSLDNANGPVPLISQPGASSPKDVPK